ncbi:hypothetical protein GGTG_09145 [Gaeumannomyces tritici R3-111a-1]|uniref:Uncharacterized protein n=1 Tax=Gaeumannomyces tritici (strain R3-111a-1) TaxID=644352 RepID=J3P6K4_GAET3|nr:hypothetical protein GGTG_09145 [Gaeumannomyces tritici R3-111a-1]EJT72279.1 hypothetical protein GGTG_09145 [Gaeumannomyces tritici R3-111a-1]
MELKTLIVHVKLARYMAVALFILLALFILAVNVGLKASIDLKREAGMDPHATTLPWTLPGVSPFHMACPSAPILPQPPSDEASARHATPTSSLD